MDNLNNIISENLKEVRGCRKLSYDKLSEITGVSKAMLSQIERGQSAPSVAILWKIATGLKIPFTALVEKKNLCPLIVRKSEACLIQSNDLKGISTYTLFNYDSNHSFEILMVSLAPGYNHISEPHSQGVEEYIIVTVGKLIITIDGIEYSLETGDAIKFHSNVTHSYSNPTNENIVFQSINYYSM